MGFFSTLNLVPSLLFNVPGSELESSLMNLPRQTPLQRDREGIKEREDGEKDREGGCAIIPGRLLFSIFPSKGNDYSRGGYYSRKYGVLTSRHESF